MEDQIKIHEFSTGINFDKLPNGGWVSKGFTGRYMNSTLGEIPVTVQRAISNKLFEVGEGASSEEAAIIGRVIPRDEDNLDYSVIAIITKGKDDEGRSCGFTRYFLCEGADSLWIIIDYIQYYKRNQEHIPYFNPLDKRRVGYPISYTPKLRQPSSNLPPESESPNLPILLNYELDTYQEINSWAEQIASLHNQPVSWAYNVRALENPKSFVLINPASDQAYDGIEDALKKSSRILVNPNFDEQGLKNAIKGIMNSEQVKEEWLKTIHKSLLSGHVTPEYWQKLFNSEGADKGIKGEISSPQMARLLTLRAIILPQALPDFWRWFNEQKNFQQESLDLQKKCKLLVQNNQELEIKLSEDIKPLITALLKDKINPDGLAKFLNDRRCVWGLAVDQLTSDIDQDLQKIAKSEKDLSCQFTKPLLGYKIGKQTKHEYQILADFLNNLGKYKLAAYFYQKSLGKVPKSVFLDAFHHKTDKETYAGEILYRQVTMDEVIISFLVNNQLKILASIGIFLFLGLIFFLGTKLGEAQGEKIGEAQGKESVCKELQDQIGSMKDPKPKIQLELCKKTLEKDELPKKES